MSWITEENLDPKLQDWAMVYKELCAILREKLPRIKHIDLYYGQDQMVDEKGSWIPFTAPAVFLQFDAAKVSDLGDNTQELYMDITMYLCLETVQDTNDRSAGQRRALEFAGMMRELHVAMHGATGDHFSPLSRVAFARKPDAPPYMYMYGQTYRCVLLDNSTSKQYAFTAPGTLGLEIEPHEAPPVPGGNIVVVHNSDDTYRFEVPAPGEHLLDDVTHIDSNGVAVKLPAMQPFTATQCVAPLPGIAVDSVGAEVLSIPPGTSLPLPDGVISYRTAANGIAYTDPASIIKVAQGLLVQNLIPRFRVFKSNGTTQIVAKDITDPQVIFPKQPVRNSMDALVSEHEVGEPGFAPDATHTLKNTADEVVLTGPIPSGGADTQTLADARVQNRATSPTWTHDIVYARGPYALPQVRIVRADGVSVDFDYAASPTVAYTSPAPPANVLRQYTTSGSWPKPTSGYFKGIWVLTVAGGGGGAAGRSSPSATRVAGGGGGGGCITLLWIPAASLASSVSYTVGSGGIGGVGSLAAGTAGGDTSFGALVTAKGGSGGASATVTPSNTGIASGCLPAFGPNSWQGAGRSTGTGGAGPAGTSGLSGSAASPSGGAGGGWSSASGATAGGAGGGVYYAGALVAGPTGGAIGVVGGAGANNAALLTLLGIAATIGIGTAGAGGGAGANGGAGGLYGAGGGGGGSQNDALAPIGDGGNGAPGCLLILEVY